MNILFVDQFDEPGGAQLCLRDLMPEVLRRGWQSRLLTPGSGLPLRPCSNGTKTAQDYLRYSFDVPRMAAALRRIVQEERIDLVYVNGPRVLPAAIGVSCPVIFHAHSRVPTSHARRLIEWSLRSTNAVVIAVSAFIARDYPSGYVIDNGVPDTGYSPRSFHRRPPRIGIIGRIAPQKGQMDFVRAAARVADAEFFVYGEPMFAEADYDRAVRELAKKTTVRFCGWTQDVAQALRDLDILAVPSGPNEAAPRVIPEAFSAGTPVIAYRSGGIPEIISHGQTGILTTARNSESLARAINRLIGLPGLRERLSLAARKEWERRFTIEKFQTTVCDLIAERATTSRLPAQLAQACANGAAIVPPEPARPE